MQNLTIFVLCFIISFTWAKQVVPVATPIVERVRPLEEACIKETGSIPDSLHHMLQWTIPKNAEGKAFMNCICMKMGYLDENGRMVKDKFRGLVKDYPDVHEEYEKMLDICHESGTENLAEAGYNMGVCFHKHTPVTFSVPSLAT